MRKPFSVELADLAASCEATGTVSLVPPFPRCVAPTEHFGFYRNACKDAMRIWLKYATSDLSEFPTEELDARVIAEELATKEIGRSLELHESRLIGEAVRDVLTALLITSDMSAEDQARIFARRIWTMNEGKFGNAGVFMEEVQEQQRLHARDEGYLLSHADLDTMRFAVMYVWREAKRAKDAALADTQERLYSPGRLFA